MDTLIDYLNFTTLQNLPESFINEKLCFRLVSKNGDEIKFVPKKYRSKELFLVAVKNSAESIKFIDELDDDICIEAIKNNYECMKYIPQEFKTVKVCCSAYVINVLSTLFFPKIMLTNELIEDAISINGTLIQLLEFEKRSKKISRLAVLNNGNSIKYVKNRNKGLCRIAADKNPESLEHIPLEIIDKELCMKCVTRKGMTLKYVPKDIMDQEIVNLAILNDPNCIKYVPEEFKNDEVISTVLKYNGIFLKFFENKRLSDDLYYLSIKNNPLSFQYLPNRLKNYESCIKMVKECGMCLAFVPLELRDLKICEIAIDQNIDSFPYVPKSIMNKNICLKVCDKFLKFIPDSMKDIEICEKAVKSDGLNIQYIPKELLNEKISKIAILQNASCVVMINDLILKKLISEWLEEINNNPVLPKLNLINSIKKGDTISTTYQSVMDHSSWSSSLWRTFSNDSRKMTVRWIRDTFEESRKYMINKDFINECISKLDNLKGTYEDDKVIYDEIEMIQKDFSF